MSHPTPHSRGTAPFSGCFFEFYVLKLTFTQCLANNVLITRVKTLPAGPSGSKTELFVMPPMLKVCVTLGLTKKEIEKAGVTIRHAITKIMTKKR